MTPKGDISIEIAGTALSLCERGQWREASELIAESPKSAELLLIHGGVLAFTRPEAAKDVLSQALRSVPDGELREKGQIWLAVCYWATGEVREARDILEAVTPSAESTRFLKALNSSIFESAKVKSSMAYLSSVEKLVDSVSDLYKGKFFNQRAYLMRRLNKTDAAIIDYETARYCFEKSDAPRFLAAATNNGAALLIDTKRFEDAHHAVDSAIQALHRSDSLYLAQVYDHKALIFLAEKKHVEAEAFAGRAVSLVSTTENKSILAECLITQAKALRFLNRHMEALNGLDRAHRIAQNLGNRSILLATAREQKETAQALTQSAHIELVETALALADGSLRGAARLVGVKFQPLDRFIRHHNITRHPKVRKSIITKPHK